MQLRARRCLWTEVAQIKEIQESDYACNWLILLLFIHDIVYYTDIKSDSYS